jgi:hypothetical protein
MATQVLLKDEALPELLALISKHQSDETAAPIAAMLGGQTPSADPSKDAKEWLATHSASEVLNLIGWPTNPEKILLLSAFHEANGGGEGWRSADMETRFSEAKERFPAWFPRDIRTAIKDGTIAPVTQRTYKVSRSGWNRIAEAIAKLSA